MALAGCKGGAPRSPQVPAAPWGLKEESVWVGWSAGWRGGVGSHGKEERPTKNPSPQDEKYWTRRKKNNVAAKRSRDARRLKENQITIRAAFLEKENTALRTEVAELRKEVGKCKTIVSKYETKYGPL